MVRYKIDRWSKRPNIQVFVSETEFDRNMSQLARGAGNIRTITFPSTVREVEYNAFEDNRSLKSAVLNEGLEKLEKDGCTYKYYTEVFYNSALQQITLPSTLRALADDTFQNCESL